mgnify:CR=1 FL=1
MESISRLTLACSLSFVMSGCGGAGTTADWTSPLYDVGSPQTLTSGSMSLAAFDSDEGYTVSFANPSDHFKQELLHYSNDGSERVVAAEGLPMHRVPVQTASGYLATQTKTHSLGPIGSGLTEVSTFDKNGQPRWTREIVPGMAIDDTAGAVDYINALLMVTSLSEDDYYDHNVDLLLTGMDQEGKVAWQKTVTQAHTDKGNWYFSHGENGDICYIADDGAQQNLSCLSPDGSPFLEQALEGQSQRKLNVFENSAVVVSDFGDNNVGIADYDFTSGVLSSYVFDDVRFWESKVEKTNDGRLHILTRSTSLDFQTLVSLDENGGKTQHTFPLHVEMIPDYAYSAWASPALGVDKNNNVYVTSVDTESRSLLGYDYMRSMAVVLKIDSDNTITTSIKGAWSGYQYMKDGKCVNRCTSVPKADFLDNMFVLDDGTVLISWVDIKMALFCDLGCGFIPTGQKWSLSKYTVK